MYNYKSYESFNQHKLWDFGLILTVVNIRINQGMMMHSQYIVCSFALAASINAFAASGDPMSEVSLPQAQVMQVIDGAIPPIPASLDSYQPDDCPGDKADNAIVARLSSTAMLWGLCQSVSGTDINYKFFIADESRAQPVYFEVPEGSAPLNSILMNPGIGNEDRVLGGYIKTAEGECPILGEWIWNGSRFRLLTYRQTNDCQDDREY